MRRVTSAGWKPPPSSRLGRSRDVMSPARSGRARGHHAMDTGTGQRSGGAMSNGQDDIPGTASRTPQVLTRVWTRESARARQLLAAGAWHPTDMVPKRPPAYWPASTRRCPPARPAAYERGPGPGPTAPTDLAHHGPSPRRRCRMRRPPPFWPLSLAPSCPGTPPRTRLLPRQLRTTWFLRTGRTARCSRRPSGRALLPDLTALFAALAAPRSSGTAALTPPAVPWEVQYTGRFRHYGRPVHDVWTADTFHCPGCGRADGPWTVACDWHLITLGCSCGHATHEHDLTFSEVWLLLPDS